MFNKNLKTRQDPWGFTQIWDPQLELWIYPRDRFSLAKGISEYVGLFFMLCGLAFFVLESLMCIHWLVRDEITLNGILFVHWPDFMWAVGFAAVGFILVDWSKT